MVDNLCNSREESLVRVSRITGRAPVFVRGDVRESTLLKHVFESHKIDAVLHFAGLKAVGKLPHLSVFGADYPTAGGTGCGAVSMWWTWPMAICGRLSLRVVGRALANRPAVLLFVTPTHRKLDGNWARWLAVG